MEPAQLEMGGPAGPQHPLPPQTQAKQLEDLFFLPDMGQLQGWKLLGQLWP